MGYWFSITEYKRKPPQRPKYLSADNLEHYDTQTDNLLRNIYFLKNWPLESLQENQRQCLVNYFNRGQILVRDSNLSDWIYIVKSGSLSVIKKLKRIDAEANTLILDKQKARKESVPSEKKENENETEDKGPKTMAEFDMGLEQSIPGIYNKADRLGILDYDALVTQKREKFKISIQPSKSESSSGAPSREISKLLKPKTNDSENDHVREPRKTTTLPSLSKSKKGVYFSTSTSEILQKPKTKKETKIEMNASFSKIGPKRKTSQIKQLEDEKPRAALGGATNRCELDDNLDKRDFRPQDITEADKDPTFVLVKVLERGDYFGVAQIAFNDQASLSVMSNGAECILISKKFFLEHASLHLMEEIRKQEIPHQTDAEMQQNLQNYVNWVSHRKRAYRSIADLIELREIKKKQYPLRYPSDYSFRTGRQ